MVKMICSCSQLTVCELFIIRVRRQKKKKKERPDAELLQFLQLLLARLC